MNLYNWHDVKAAGDCRRYLEDVVGLEPVRPGWYNRPWSPGSDSGALHAESGRWYDHVEKVGGSIIDLAARAQNLDTISAASKLGDWLNLTPTTGRNAEEKPRPRVVATYVYTDPIGLEIARKLRFEPGWNGAAKSFAWRRKATPAEIAAGHALHPITGEPISARGKLCTVRNGEVRTRQGVESVLYRLPDVIDAETVYLCEGEKDADLLHRWNLAATTSPDGAGQWSDSYTAALAGRRVVIVADADDAGLRHVATVIDKLRAADCTIAVAVPGRGMDKKGADVHDWASANNYDAATGPAALAAIARDIDDQPTPATNDPLGQAKRCNAAPLRNYRLDTITDAQGREKPYKRPRNMGDLLDDMRARFLGFPRLLGDGTLFDFDLDLRQIREIRNASSLFAWISHKAKAPADFITQDGAHTKAELFEGIFGQAIRYNAVFSMPTHPLRPDVFYLTRPDQLPRASGGHHIFRDFVDLFSFAGEVDRVLFASFVLTCFFHQHSIHAPIFVITSDDRQEAGKTTAVEMVALLLGTSIEDQSPISVDFRQLQSDSQGDKITKRILSASGRRKHIFLLDNVDGPMRCPELAKMVTESTITGMAPYGRGEESRPNDLVYAVTVNDGQMDRDLTRRAVVIKIAKARRSSTWRERVIDYIDAHRLQIAADCLDLLQSGAKIDTEPLTRFEVWERRVLHTMINNHDQLDRIARETRERQSWMDVDLETTERIRAAVHQLLASAIISSEVCLFFDSAALHSICHGLQQRYTPQKFNGWVGNGYLPEFSQAMRWQRRASGHRIRVSGRFWDTVEPPGARPPSHMVTTEAGRVVVRAQT